MAQISQRCLYRVCLSSGNIIRITKNTAIFRLSSCHAHTALFRLPFNTELGHTSHILLDECDECGGRNCNMLEYTLLFKYF